MIRIALLLLCWFAGSAFAQPYPAKPIRLIAPYPPGGGVDTVSRIVADKLAARLGQAIPVDNKPGAGGTIGGAELVKGAPHTMPVRRLDDVKAARDLDLRYRAP